MKTPVRKSDKKSFVASPVKENTVNTGESKIIDALNKRQSLTLCLKRVPAKFTYEQLCSEIGADNFSACKFFYNNKKKSKQRVDRVFVEFASETQKSTAAAKFSSAKIEFAPLGGEESRITDLSKFNTRLVSVNNVPAEFTQQQISEMFPAATNIYCPKRVSIKQQANMFTVLFGSDAEAFEAVLQHNGSRVEGRHIAVGLMRLTKERVKNVLVLLNLRRGFLTREKIVEALPNAAALRNPTAAIQLKLPRLCVITYASAELASQDHSAAREKKLAKLMFHPDSDVLDKFKREIQQTGNAGGGDAMRAVTPQMTKNQRKRKLSASSDKSDLSEMEQTEAAAAENDVSFGAAPPKKMKNKRDSLAGEQTEQLKTPTNSKKLLKSPKSSGKKKMIKTEA